MALTWHCAETHPFSELMAERDLERLGFQPFNPKCQTVVVTRGREVQTTKPYLPGYIFIPWDDADDHTWRKARDARGIRKLMYGAHEKPARIRQDAMQILLDKCNGQLVKQTEIDRELKKIIWVGSTVVVKDGPMEGFKGKAEWAHRDRVRVMLSFLGAERPVEFRTKELEVVT